jgi:hypothetical protein
VTAPETLWLFSGDSDVKFRASVLGAGASRPAGQGPWAAVTLYRTPAGTYLADMSGRSLRPEEGAYHRLQVFRSPGAVVRALSWQRGGSRALPAHTRTALSEAAERDPGIRDALVTEGL